MILENGVDPHDGPVASNGKSSRDRRRARRRRRRHPRDGASEPRRGRPRRTLRPPRLHGLARPLPDVVAFAARRVARGGERPRRRARARTFASAAGKLDPRVRLEIDRMGRAADRRGSRRRHGRHPCAALLQGLPLRLAQLRRAGAGERRPPGRGRSRRARRRRRADGDPAGGVGVAVPCAVRDADRGRVRRGHARRASHRGEPRRRRDPRQGRLARRSRDLPARTRARRAHPPRLAVGAVRAAPRARGARDPLGDRRRLSCGSAT